MKIVSCRSCGTSKVQGDMCTGAMCPRNTRVPAQRSVRTSTGSSVQGWLNNPGTHWLALSDGPRMLQGEQYVADYDGRHYLQSREV